MVLSLGIIAFALNAVAQINMVHCVLAAFCVGVRISGPQEGLDQFGSPFDVYSAQRFWEYICSNPDVLDLTETLIMSPYEFMSKTHSLSTEDLGKIFIDSFID